MPDDNDIKFSKSKAPAPSDESSKPAAHDVPAAAKTGFRDLGSLMGLDPDPRMEKDLPEALTDQAGPEVLRPRSSPCADVFKPSIWMASPERHQNILESLRMVKSKISQTRKEGACKHFLITGAEPGVGTSTVAQNLAVVLANDFLDQRFLLVDANLSYPSLHRTFGLPADPGVLNYLLSDSTLEEVISGSGWPNLDVITIGKSDHNAASPFDLERFRHFLKEISAAYDLILIDSAPALRSSQTRVISSQVDWVIIVAEACRTRWEVLVELKNQLAQDGAKTLGGILNKRRFVIPRWAYRFI